MNAQHLEIPFRGKSFFLDIADGNMVNLNHIHSIVGTPKNQSPGDWKRLDSTKKLINSISNKNTGKSRIFISKRGRNGGTFAHWQLALAYAQYLSPELHFTVNAVFKERLEEIIDPELGISRSQKRARETWKAQGKSEEWIAKREEGKLIREVYVETLVSHDVKFGVEVGHCTNQIYKGLFNKDSCQIEQALRMKNPNLPKKVNIRDYAKLSAIAAIGLAEALSSEKIEKHNAKGVDACAKISLDKATTVRSVLEDSRNKDNIAASETQSSISRNTEKNKHHIANLRAAIKKKTS